MKDIKVHLRWMILKDMPAVLEIENDSFPAPWSEDDFRRCLRQKNCIGFIAEYESRVVGFMVYELFPHRLEVVNFAVAVGYRRFGVGAQMLAKLKGKLSHQRRNRICVQVCETNTDAQLFFHSQGFRAVCVLHDFYDDTDEDAYEMQHRIETLAPVQ